MKTYKYYLPGYIGDADDPYEFKGYTPWSSDELAEYAAEDFYFNHDGWEDKWPLTFCVLLDGEWITHKVDREAVPSFYVVG